MRSHRTRPGRLASTAIAVAVATLTAGCTTSLPRRFQAHINYLAGDELEGRGVGTRGLEVAAEYIAKRFAEIGLEPAGGNGDYFQTFKITLRRTLTDASRVAFAGDPVARRLREDFIPFNFSSDESFSGDVVFCGYGIIAPDKEHDDFNDLDLTDKVALILRGEPPSWSDENGYPTQHAMLRHKVYNAKDRGAVAVLIVNQSPEEGETDKLVEFETEGAAAYGIPAFHITREMANAQLLRACDASHAGIPLGHKLAEWVETELSTDVAAPLAFVQEFMDASSYLSGPLPQSVARGQAVFKKNSAPTSNVVGILRGVGPVANEFIVIGAHYDHLGIRKPMMRRFKAGKLVKDTLAPQIHNGADDNASGTSGLIEIARMFADGPRPRRSILFVAFTAEETGLHGSKHYVDNPSIPLDHTVAMLNMDSPGV